MESTSTVKPTCTTCIHWEPLQPSPRHCWDCLMTKTLVHWEPEELPVSKLSLADQALLDEGKPKTALESQVDGSHYKNLKIQPMEYSMANKLDACQHTVIKYITRFRDKGGIKDLDKAIHAIELLKQFEYESKA
jgi:hypothetical protein